MLARYAFLSVLALGSLAAAASMVPGDLERLSMLERDGRHELAMVELQRLYDAGERNPRLMLRLYNLKVRFGIVDDARAILEEYARRRPSDVEAQVGLIRFYQTNQLEVPYVNALRGLQERTRSRELLAELLSFYRMTGRYREEEELLERALRANRASPADLERLGLLASARGDLQRAARALRRADARLDEQSRPARVGLFRVLVALKEPDEAHQRSLVWLRSWHSAEQAVEFMDALSLAGRTELALDIGNRFGGPGNDASLVSAELLHELGRNAEALQKLREYESGGLPEEVDRVQRFVAVASATDGIDMALRAARTIGLRKIGSPIIVDLIDSLHDATEVRPGSVSPELLRGFAGEIEARLQNLNPIGQEATDGLVLPDDQRLFVVQLAVGDGDRDMARRLISSVDPDRLSSSDLAQWTELQVASGLRATAFPHLPRTWQSKDRSQLTARRLPRPDRPAALATSPAATPAPSAARADGGPVPPLPPPSAGQSLRDAKAAQSTAPDTTSARARRQRRRLAAIERRRERTRAAAARREQQSLSPAVAIPAPKPVVVPAPPNSFSPLSGGG